jgi:ankyrin repeat protein
MGGHLDVLHFWSKGAFLTPKKLKLMIGPPFNLLSNRSQLKIVEYLLEGHSFSQTAFIDSVRQTILHMAASEGDLEISKYLMENQQPTLHDYVSFKNETALHSAGIYRQS